MSRVLAENGLGDERLKTLVPPRNVRNKGRKAARLPTKIPTPGSTHVQIARRDVTAMILVSQSSRENGLHMDMGMGKLTEEVQRVRFADGFDVGNANECCDPCSSTI